jgi:antitoxin component YwqK of YwqJK toxin-antitoxin module
MKLISTLTLFLLYFSLSAQSKKPIYFDKYWIETSDKESAQYFRLTEKTTDTSGNKLILVRDYYITSEPQMVATFKSLKPDIPHGIHTTFYKNGKKKTESEYVDGKLNGKSYAYYESGKLKTESNYSLDTIIGISKTWHENDTLSIVAKYLNGKLNGNLYCFHANGKLRRLDYYEGGILKQGKCFTSEEKDTAYYPFYVHPTFPGGINAFYEAFKKNLILPKFCPYNIPIIKLTVSVVIDTTGEYSSIYVIKSDNECYNYEVQLAIAKTRGWISGQLNGFTERLSVTFPISVYTTWK